MRRLAFTFAIFSILGAIANLLVAWTCEFADRSPQAFRGQFMELETSPQARAAWTSAFGPSQFMNLLEATPNVCFLPPGAGPLPPSYKLNQYYVDEFSMRSFGLSTLHLMDGLR